MLLHETHLKNDKHKTFVEYSMKKTLNDYLTIRLMFSKQISW
jgi:hypothetical protein